jgi:hypothetical protein
VTATGPFIRLLSVMTECDEGGLKGEVFDRMKDQNQGVSLAKDSSMQQWTPSNAACGG